MEALWAPGWALVISIARHSVDITHPACWGTGSVHPQGKVLRGLTPMAFTEPGGFACGPCMSAESFASIRINASQLRTVSALPSSLSFFLS